MLNYQPGEQELEESDSRERRIEWSMAISESRAKGGVHTRSDGSVIMPCVCVAHMKGWQPHQESHKQPVSGR